MLDHEVSKKCAKASIKSSFSRSRKLGSEVLRVNRQLIKNPESPKMDQKSLN